MKKSYLSVLSLLMLISCEVTKKETLKTSTELKPQVISNENYTLVRPSKHPAAVLILFGGFPESIADIQREFNITNIANENNIATLFLNFNRKLWLEDVEKKALATLLQNTIIEHKLPTTNLYIGGFSSGGNISLLISDYITEMEAYYINPKGVFIIDAPVDFLAMYQASERIIKRTNENDGMQAESKWLLQLFKKQFGNPINNISKYEYYSVYTSKTKSIQNIQHLKNIKVRFYTEPDSLWWKQFNANYEDMNAYNIKQLYNTLKEELKWGKVEYIATKNKGYRQNGDRNPHSWSIVDTQELIHWMLSK